MKNLSEISHELDMVTKQYVDNAAEAKVDKVEGKHLSTNDFTDEYKDKLEQLNVVQVSEIPTASAANVGNIIQYIGVTDSSYTNGFFYKNEEITQENGTKIFSWMNIKVQEDSKGVTDYNELENIPTVNGVELKGDITAADLGINDTNMYFGSEAPSDDNVVMWIDPTGTPTDVLTMDNEIAYDPTGEYNPATKKYVDESIANIEFPNPDLSGLATTEYVDNKVDNIKIPEKTSELTNDSGFITDYSETDPLYSADKDKLALKTDIPTKTSQLTNDSNFLTQHQDISDLAKKSELPTKVSDLNNDTGFIINTVNNLTNYYKKSETYTQTEINNLINAITTLNIEVVASLPTSNISTTTIYLKGSKKEGTNSYEEYIYVNGTWELIGTTAIDLTPYATKTYVDTEIDGITKSSLGLGNVENKSSATIRGELTSSNVTTALGFTPSQLALGETSTTAYRGDRGKTAYDHSQVTSGNPHKVSKSDVGLANVENKSSATIRGEITSTNVTTALGFTPAKNDHGHEGVYSYLEDYKTIAENTGVEKYCKIMTITPNASSYKDANYSMEIVGRTRKKILFNIAMSSSNDNYLKDIVATYDGDSSLGSNLKVYYYKDETNATSRIEVWTKMVSWEVLEFFPKTFYNKGTCVKITWNLDISSSAFPTNATTTITVNAKSWAGNAATATTANSLKDVTATATELNYVKGVTSSVQTQLNNKAAKSDVLTKTNTTAYTPTANYHPATKAYVDSKVAGDTTAPGTIKIFSNVEDRDGYLLCNGNAVLKTNYSSLTNKLNNIYSWQPVSTDFSYALIENDSPDNNTIGYVYTYTSTTITLYSTTDFIQFTKIADLTYTPESSTGTAVYGVTSIKKTGDVFVIWRTYKSNSSTSAGHTVDLYYQNQLYPSACPSYSGSVAAHADHNILIVCRGNSSDKAYAYRFELPSLTYTTVVSGSFKEFDSITYSSTSNIWWATCGGTDIGIYKSTDDGKTWSQVSFYDGSAGSSAFVGYNRYYDKLYFRNNSTWLIEYEGNTTTIDDEGAGGTKIYSNTTNVQGMLYKDRIIYYNKIYYLYKNGTFKPCFETIESNDGKAINIGEKIFMLQKSSPKTLYQTLSSGNAVQLPTMNDSTNQIYGYIKY